MKSNREVTELIDMWNKLAWIIFFLFVGALLIYKAIVNVVIEYYSPGFMSESIVDARSRGVFISQPFLKSNVVSWKKSKYRIREAWIEQATQIKYDFLFFKRVIPTGNRLVLMIDNVGNPPGEDFLYVDEVICNDSIRVSTMSHGTPILIYTEFTFPAPVSIECSVED